MGAVISRQFDRVSHFNHPGIALTAFPSLSIVVSFNSYRMGGTKVFRQNVCSKVVMRFFERPKNLVSSRMV